MINIFRTKNTMSVLLLLLIAFLIKIPSLIHPPIFSLQEENGILNIFLKKHIDTSLSFSYIFLLVHYVLSVIQALQLNYVVNHQRLYTQYNYLPAFIYILILNVLPEANTLSVPFIINSVLMSILFYLLTLYDTPKPRQSIYNVGLLLGITILLYTPSYLYITVLFLTLFIIRPFRIKEWIIAILGILTPYYFLATYLFLSEQKNVWVYLPNISLHNPITSISFYNQIAIGFIIILLIIGLIYEQKNVHHMVIQIRKSWTILIFAMFISIIIPFVNKGTGTPSFAMCSLTFAAIITNAGLYFSKKTIASIICWLLLLYGMLKNYIDVM